MTTLATFTEATGQPDGPLIEGRDGSFYGFTLPDNNIRFGNIYKVTRTGVLKVLAPIPASGESNPIIRTLMQARDGNFYGTTALGGKDPTIYNPSVNAGIVFRMTPTGVITPLVYFNGSNGGEPAAALMQASDGYLYGTTSKGGAFNQGTLFRLSVKGDFDTLMSFEGSSGGGTFPKSSLVEGADGKLYGTTSLGGIDGEGTLFSVSLQAKQSQTITFPPFPPLSIGDEMDLQAKASSGLPVTYQTSGPVKLEGNTLKVTGAGFCVVAAYQGGGVLYSAAPIVRQSFRVPPQP